MINDFLSLVNEVWETGIRGVGINDLLTCLSIFILSLIIRSFFKRKSQL